MFLDAFNLIDMTVGRVFAPRSGGAWIDPGLRHTNIFNNGISCSSLGTRLFGVGLELVTPVSGDVRGRYSTLRQNYKSEHGAFCRNQTPS